MNEFCSWKSLPGIYDCPSDIACSQNDRDFRLLLTDHLDIYRRPVWICIHTLSSACHPHELMPVCDKAEMVVWASQACVGDAELMNDSHMLPGNDRFNLLCAKLS